MMSQLIKREVPLSVATIIIALTFLDYYVHIEVIRSLVAIFRDWAVIIVVMASGVGVINMLMRTARSIEKRVEYWYLDIWMLVMVLVMTVTGLIGAFGTHPAFDWIIMSAYQPIDAAVKTMVAFDIISVLYRSFRFKSKESMIMLVFILIVMIRNMPLTGGLFPGYMPFGNWMYNFPSSGAARAYKIITAIGVVAFTIRTMLWHEKPAMGVVD
jgi:hypothetical protein